MNNKIPSLIIVFFFIGIGLFAQEDGEKSPTFNEEMAIGINGDSI